MERNRYADLLRVVAIGSVVYGHWLLISVTYRNGQLSGADALDYVRWGRWVTWAFQVIPVFFLVGGYANARSWTAHQAGGETWTVWVRDRAMRLWWPTALFLVVAVLAVAAAEAAGAGRAELGQACWLAALQLWFLPVYLPQPAIGSAGWWELRPAWFALLTVVLVPLVLLLTWAQQPMARLPAGLGPSGPWSPALLLLGLTASMVGLARLAIAGFAPGGRLAVPVLAACALGLAATLFTGRARPEAAERRALRPEVPDQPSQAA